MNYLEKIDKQIENFERVKNQYSIIDLACQVIKKPAGDIIGRNMSDIKDGLKDPEKPNIILLAEAGMGKTAFTQGFTYSKEGSDYLVLSVSIEKFMLDATGNKDSQIANGLVGLIDDVKRYTIEQNTIIVLFIDEFHSLVQFSKAATEKLKPILEESAYYGFRIIGATTFEEYDEFIGPNRALSQRLIRITLSELPKNDVIEVLKGRARKHGVDKYCSPEIFEEVYDVSRQVEPSKAQPRASVDIFNSIVGHVTLEEKMINGINYKTFAKPNDLGLESEFIICRKTLNKVIRRTYNIDIDNELSIEKLTNTIRSRLFGQEDAVETILGGLELIIAGFSDSTRPRYSFLSAGSTGVGKTELAKIICEMLQIPLKRFDMSRYSRPEQAVDFANDLALAAWSNPNAYILIDEIEKSSKEAVNILLQVLDDARLTMKNNSNRVASFVGTIINATTNAGSSVFVDHKSFSSKEKINKSLIYQALQNDPTFESAVLGRFDAIVPFKPLTNEINHLIAVNSFRYEISEHETSKFKVYASDEVFEYLVRDKTSQGADSGGARDIKRNVRNIAIQPVAKYLCKNKEKNVPVLLYVAGNPRFKYKDQPNADAGWIELTECYEVDKVETWVNKLSDKLGMKIVNKGIYVPKTMGPNEFANKLVRYIKENGKVGCTIGIKSDMDLTNLIFKTVEI